MKEGSKEGRHATVTPIYLMGGMRQAGRTEECDTVVGCFRTTKLFQTEGRPRQWGPKPINKNDM